MQVLQTKKDENFQQSSAMCEKASDCAGANEKCYRHVFVETMVCDPSKRWMYCYAWKQKLGMVFDKELGVYILPEWKATLMKRVKGC